MMHGFKGSTIETDPSEETKPPQKHILNLL